MTRIAILGATGSIGTSALAVAEAHPDRLRVVGLAAGEQRRGDGGSGGALPALAVAMASGPGLDGLRAALGALPPGTASAPMA